MHSVETAYGFGHHQDRQTIVYEDVGEDDRVRGDVWSLMDTAAAVRGNIILSGRNEQTMTIAERHATRYWENKLAERRLDVEWALSEAGERMSYREFMNNQTGPVIDGSFVPEKKLPEAIAEPVDPLSVFASRAERLFFKVMQSIGLMTREHSLR